MKDKCSSLSVFLPSDALTSINFHLLGFVEWSFIYRKETHCVAPFDSFPSHFFMSFMCIVSVFDYNKNQNKLYSIGDNLTATNWDWLAIELNCFRGKHISSELTVRHIVISLYLVAASRFVLIGKICFQIIVKFLHLRLFHMQVSNVGNKRFINDSTISLLFIYYYLIKAQMSCNYVHSIWTASCVLINVILITTQLLL